MYHALIWEACYILAMVERPQAVAVGKHHFSRKIAGPRLWVTTEHIVAERLEGFFDWIIWRGFLLIDAQVESIKKNVDGTPAFVENAKWQRKPPVAGVVLGGSRAYAEFDGT